METTIDSAGRVVIPKKLRDQAGLAPGMKLKITCRDGRLAMEPVAVPVRLERRGRFLVAVREPQLPPMSAEAWEAALEEVRAERDRQVLGLEDLQE